MLDSSSNNNKSLQNNRSGIIEKPDDLEDKSSEQSGGID